MAMRPFFNLQCSQRPIESFGRKWLEHGIPAADYYAAWVFGKDVKGREIYIKIMLGAKNSQTICISFHIAEHPLKYPLK
jgi:hypothetical protein